MWIVFTIEGCTYCKQLKTLLHKQKIPFLERTLAKEERTFFMQCSGKKLVPQLGWTDSTSPTWSASLTLKKTQTFYAREIPKIQWIGGYTDFVEMLDHAQTLSKAPWFQHWSIWCQHMKIKLSKDFV